MQFSRFVNGGYVLHRIKLQGVSWYSAWFDRDGKLIDMERRYGQRSYSVPANYVKTREAIQRIGHRYKHIPTTLTDGI